MRKQPERFRPAALNWLPLSVRTFTIFMGAASRAKADIATDPAAAAARMIQCTERGGIDLPDLVAVLRDHAAAVHSGNLADAESMLINQATTLQALFVRLAGRGMSHDQIPGFKVNMRLALHALVGTAD